MRKIAFASLLLMGSSLSAQEPYEPLYAGTLLQFYGENIPPGHISVEPYTYILQQYGTYNPHWNVVNAPKITSETQFLFLETGITPFVDFSLNIPAVYTQTHGGNTLHVGDVMTYLGFQFMRMKKGTWRPDLRLLIGESFPTGKYQHLDPKKSGADISGTGAYGTLLIFVAEKIFYTCPTHPFSINLNLYYNLYTKVAVEGVNAYGGNPDSHGVVNPGNQFIFNFAAEFSLTRNWVIGMDLHYIHNNSSTFHGRGGTGFPPGLPSSEQWSIAPCLEYNFSEKFCVSGGSWFSLAGRNSSAFAGGVLTLYWYF